MKKYLIYLLISFSCLSLMALDINYKKAYRNYIGTKQYKKQKTAKAVNTYQKNSIDYPDNPILHYNLANAHYQAGDYDSALKEYQISLNNKKFNHADLANHNIGNIHYQNKDYKSAMDFYRKAMVLNPKNTDSRYNYELAKRKLNEQQDKKNNQNNDQNQDKDQDKQNQDKQKQNPQEQQQQNEPTQAQMDAQSILKAIEEQEKEDLKKKKQNAAKYKSGKYW